MALIDKQTFVAPKRSNYPLDNIVVGDSDFGFVRPVRVLEVLGGCSYKINLGSQIETAATSFPVYSSMRSNYRAFFFPRRLLATVNSSTLGRVPAIYNPEGATEEDAVKYVKFLPYWLYDSSPDPVPTVDDQTFMQLIPSRGSLYEALGFPYGVALTSVRDDSGDLIFPSSIDVGGGEYKQEMQGAIAGSPYSAASLVAYWDMIYNYYANHHFGYVPVRVCYDRSLQLTDIRYSYYYILISQLSDWLVAVKTGRAAGITADFRLFDASGNHLSEFDLVPSRFALSAASTVGGFAPFIWAVPDPSSATPSEREIADSVGLSLCTFSPDINTAWISDTEYSNWLSRAKINVQNGSVAYEDIISASSFYKEAAKFAFGDGTFEDFFAAVNGVRAQPAATCCQYLGGFSRRLDFQSIRQSAATDSGALADIGGYAAGAMTGHICNFYTREPGYIIIVHTLVPDLVYSRGIESYLLKTETDDFYSPNFANIGYQPRLLAEVDASSKVVSLDLNRSIGFQPAWTEYTTAVSRAFGSMNYAGNKSGWTFQAPAYNPEGAGVRPAGSHNVYCHPQDFQNIFVLDSPLSHNFYCQYGLSVKARLIIPKRNMPKLSL